MATYSDPSELQYMKGGVIDSNSQFYYKDLTSFNYEHRIKLDPEGETRMDIRNQIPPHHLSQAIIKELPQDNNLDAFEKADIQSEFTKQYSLHKYQQLLQREKDIGEIVSGNFKVIRDDIQKEKDDLKETLTRIVRDTLIFSKNNNPINSMLPNHISDLITKIKSDQHINVSISSLNMSSISKGTTKSIKKYESHPFLKSLGLDLNNLNLNNINIDVEKAYKSVKSWNTIRKDAHEVIKYLVVNEIMGVEEKRASQKVGRLNTKIKVYKTKKRESQIKYQKEQEEGLQADALKPRRMKIKEIKPDDKPKERPRSTIKPRTAPSITAPSTNSPPIKEIRVSERLLRDQRTKSKKKKNVPKEKVRYQYNSYKHVDKILNFIKQSDELSGNPAVLNHFLNIKNKKKMDALTHKLLMKNKLEVANDSFKN